MRAHKAYSTINMQASHRHISRARKIVQSSSGMRSMYWCGKAANVRSGQVRVLVQNGEHSFCSSSTFHFDMVVEVRVMKLEGSSLRYDEEKSVRGHSFALQKYRGASSAEPAFFSSPCIDLEQRR